MSPTVDNAIHRPRLNDAPIFDRRAVALGLLVSFLIGAGTLIWQIATRENTAKAPVPLSFDVSEPKIEEFKLRDPKRDMLQERVEETPDLSEERPDIHITTTPTETQVMEEVIQSPQQELETTKIEPDAKQMEIQDAPEQIQKMDEIVDYALNPIAADTNLPADLFKYKEPSPVDRMAVTFVRSAPKPGRALKLLPQAFGDQNAPSMGELGPMNINLFGTGNFFKNMSRFGEIRARTAVDAALHWLAIHQASEGHWNCAKYDGENSADLAMTGLAALAFMGAGHTMRKGEYSRNTLRAIRSLMRRQGADGGLGSGYTHAICTIALCESYGRARDEEVGRAAQRAVIWIEKAVNPDGGWRYTPREAKSDLSVAAWFIQALKAAKLAKIRFDHAIFSRGLTYLDSVTDKGGNSESTGGAAYEFAEGMEYGAGSANLTPAGMMIRQFNGLGARHPLLLKAAELVRSGPPAWKAKNFYRWYYATYAMHNMGGEYRVWWNRRIRDVLLEHQSRSGDHAGSWDPKNDQWAKTGGRVFTTALGALCLEVYYRYSESLDSFGTAPDLDELLLQRR